MTSVWLSLLLLLSVSVPTHRYDPQRTGLNTSEVALTQAVVASPTNGFGFLFNYSVDGYVYAQPLIADGVSIQGVTTVAIIATMHNSMYAFDANSSTLLWHRSLGTPSSTSDPDLIVSENGCLSTPTLDAVGGFLYAVCRDSAPSYKLYKLNLLDGSDAIPPVTISATYNSISFSTNHLQRPGLLLTGGKIYVDFGSIGDIGTWQGWHMQYDAATLAQSAVWCSSCGGSNDGGIWLGGGGPLVDGLGNTYTITGNGSYDGSTDFGCSFVKFDASLALIGHYHVAGCENTDQDIGSGPIVLSGSLLLGGGKFGILYVLNSTTMALLQSFDPGLVAQQRNSYLFAGSTLFLAGEDNNSHYAIKTFHWNGSSFDTSPTHQTSYFARYPAPSLGYSSNGTTAGSDILWAVTTGAAGGISTKVAGILRAYDANLTELYNSDKRSWDTLGNISKFTAPVPANGKVYVATSDNAVKVYGAVTLPSTRGRGAVTMRGGVSF